MKNSYSKIFREKIDLSKIGIFDVEDGSRFVTISLKKGEFDKTCNGEERVYFLVDETNDNYVLLDVDNFMEYMNTAYTPEDYNLDNYFSLAGIYLEKSIWSAKLAEEFIPNSIFRSRYAPLIRREAANIAAGSTAPTMVDDLTKRLVAIEDNENAVRIQGHSILEFKERQIVRVIAENQDYLAVIPFEISEYFYSKSHIISKKYYNIYEIEKNPEKFI